MSHPFGDLLTQYLHRKHGLSQARLAAGILQAPSIISDMSQGKRLSGPQARQRVTAIIAWLQQQGAVATLDEANVLLNAAGMAPLQERDTDEALLIRKGSAQADGSARADQQQHPALDALALPLRAPGIRPRHNLPPQLTPFIGRTDQIAQLVQQLQMRRLLTLTGAGGVGKTRLALEVATRLCAGFGDGVWFVDLASINDPGSISRRILDLWRVPEQPEHSPLATLTTYLRAKQALLILDNCEHLLEACAELAETILQHCPQVSLLATSREALNIRAELPWWVPSLTRPANSVWDGSAAPAPAQLTPAALLPFEAVSLFVERTRLHQPGFALTTANAPAVAHICNRLDGIPLALEMAATRVNVFTVEELATQLEGAFDARFQLLTSGDYVMSTIDQIIASLPDWATQAPQIESLSGGITNQNYKVTVGDEIFVVRICAQGVGIHGIHRQVEQQCAKAAAQIGVAPEVYAFVDNLPNGGEALISRFVDGATLNTAMVGNAEHLPAVIELIQRYHQLDHFAGRFDVFRIFANCLAAAQQMNAPLPPFIDQVQQELRRIESALQQNALPLVACHNDLLPANFLQARQGKLWLLDWEYAGWGDRFFDLGNLSVNNEFTDAQDEALLTGYFGQVNSADWARLKLMKIVSDAREGIWGLVQWGISPLDFDFAAYGNRHLERFMHNCASTEVARWLADAN